MEWLLIELIQLLEPTSSIETITAMTSGRIARRLQFAIRAAGLPAADLGIGDRYAGLVDRRNDIIHAHPATDEAGAQRLYRWAPGRGRIAFVSDTRST